MSPATSDEQELHQRLLQGDETASKDLFLLYLDPLTTILSTKYQRAAQFDETLVVDAVTDALFDYVGRPTTYKPDLKSLKNYLIMAADRNLQNLWRKVRPISERETSLDLLVELNADLGNNVLGRMETELIAMGNVAATDRYQRLRTLIPDRQDFRVLEQMIAGVRENEAYARILGVESLPVAEQRRLVKRAKDRLKKVLQRSGFAKLTDVGDRNER